MQLPADIAVYAEYSDSIKLAVSGWNARVFNRILVHEGSNVQLEQSTGIITILPGLYHLTASSQVSYCYTESRPNPGSEGWPTEPFPNAGYCRLRYAQDVDCENYHAIAIGTISNANMLPSLIDTILDVPEQAELVLEHQAGMKGVELKGICLQDNSANSSWHVFAQLSIRRIGASATTYQHSSLCRAFNAAFQSYLAGSESYRRLFASYIGVAPKFVPVPELCEWATPEVGTALSSVLKSGVLRFGYAEAQGFGYPDGSPYVYHGANGELAGTDWELGNALTAMIRDHYFYFAAGKGLRAEWIRVQVSASGDPEKARFEALAQGLKDRLFDIAMSGQAHISSLPKSPLMSDVDWTMPTALLFTNILYTGRDKYDLSGLVGATREQFIERVKAWPSVKMMCVSNPGPSPANSAELVTAINNAGGHATLDSTGTLPSITAAIANQTIHFSVGDAVASAWIGNQPGFKGLNLNIAAATKPLQTAQPVAAFTLRGL